MKIFGWIVLGLLALFVLPFCILLMRGCAFAGNWANKAMTVAVEQVDPAVLLKKYEWFKDAASQLDKKKADIEVYKTRLAQYKGIDRKDMDRSDKEQMSIWQSEVAGIIASYNGLAAEYNSAMAKINYRFCNVGQLPNGATEPMPREFATYQYSF